MKKTIFSTFLLLGACLIKAQLSPVITSWLQNNTTTGTYYVNGNSTAQSNGILVNCQQVQYSSGSVYVSTKGIPAYPVGPFTGDGNQNNAGNQNAIFKFPLNPTVNTGSPTIVNMGNAAIYINGVAHFSFGDGVSWKSSTNAFAGGPLGGQGDNVWNRDAIKYEKLGFDCSKGHPAGTNYHHHQNPSAFDKDLIVISTICNLYDADGLYTINTAQHSPLIGFAYDGFPIYGAYAYANTDGTGGIVRMKSGYQLRNMIARTTNVAGATVSSGPPINATYPLGSFGLDYEWVAHTGDASYLDEHNGRICKTPEYPNGTYCYFATVDANHNSAFPYVLGPTFYGNKVVTKVTSITEPTTTYTTPILPPNAISEKEFNNMLVEVFPNPSSDLVAIKIGGLLKENLKIELLSTDGKIIKSTQINKGQSLAFFDLQAVYSGIYFVKISNLFYSNTKKIVVTKE